MRTPRSIVLVLLGCWTLLVLVVLLNSAGSLAIDIKPELYLAPGRMVRFFANPWQESPQLGWPSFNVGLAPVPAVVAGLQALGLSPVLSMRVLRIVLYTVAGWGLARLHRSLSADGGTPASRAAAAVAYVANPYAVVGGSTLAVLLPYALLPWQSLFLVRALRSTRPWRDVAGFGICFAAMSGMNAGVIPLLQLLTVPFLVWWVRRDARIAARHLWRVLAACAGTVVLVSLYWLVPSVIGAGQGVAVLENSETVEGINGTSSLAEVLRGLGFWGMYGQGARGPYQPGFADYLTSGPVVVLTLLLPAALAVAALVARGTARVVGLALLTVTALLMVGLYPPDNPSPLGHGLQWLFENVPVTGAFRTLNKLGSVLVLAAALLLAAAVASVSIRPAARWRWVAGAVVAGLAVAAVFPALSGGLYPRVLDVPGYWHDAADQLNKGRQDSRVWFVPGAVQPHYRWATDQPDDLALPLITGPSLVRTTLPVASPYAANFLAQVDTQLNEDSLYPGSLSAAARYLGVRNVLLRNDVVWEDYFGARPATLQGLIGGDRGLQLAGQFGSPGDGTTAAGDSSSLAAVERELPPLQDFAVTAHRPIVRAESLRGMVVVAGDAGSFSPLVASGLLADGQSFRYAGDLTAAAFTSLLGPDRRLVLTDTNRRRTSVLGRLAGNQGPLLPAGADAGSSRTLFGPQDQTVLTVTGGATVSASQVGSSFGVLAEASPENALDGDPSTSWQFGDFGTAAGQQLQVRFDRPRRLGLVRMTAATLGTVQIDRLGLRAGGRTREVDVAADATAAVDLGQRPVRSLTVSVLATRGEGYNRVGVSEIDVDGLRLDRVATMPDTFSRLATDLGGDGRVALAQTPLDVVMSRSRGTDLATDDEEARLLRDFTLPDDRQYRAYGLVRPGRGVTEAELDAIAGGDGQVTVTSSSRAFDLPELRGSQALDGDLTTAWVPGGASVGESLLVQAPPQQVDHVDVSQVASPGGTLTGWATKVRVEAGRSSAVEAVVGPGRTRIPVPPTRAGRLRLTVLATNSPGAVVRISEVGFGSAQVARDPGRAARECVTVGSLDGNPLQVRVLAQPVGTAPVLVGRCRDTDLALRAGPHELRGNASWVADLLVLRDERGEQVVTPGPVPEVSVSKGFGPRYTVHAAGSQEPWLLVVGQSHDPIWSARSDNGGLGDPLAVDGYANGWVVPAGRSGTIRAAVSTQTVSTAALVVSSLGILVLLVIACLPRRRPAGAPQQAPVAAVPRRPSEGVAWLAAAVLAGVGLGVWGLAAVAVLAAWHAVDRPKVRDVSVLAVVLLVAVPVVWVAGNWSRWGVVSTDLVLDNPWPHRVAGIGLLVLLVAVARSERPSVDAGEGEE